MNSAWDIGLSKQASEQSHTQAYVQCSPISVGITQSPRLIPCNYVTKYFTNDTKTNSKARVVVTFNVTGIGYPGYL